MNLRSGENEFLPHLCGANASYRRHLLNQIDGFSAKRLTAKDIDASWRIQLETGTRSHSQGPSPPEVSRFGASWSRRELCHGMPCPQ